MGVASPCSQLHLWKGSLCSAHTHTAVSACVFTFIFKQGICTGARYPAGTGSAGASLRQWLSAGCSDIPVPGWCVVPRSQEGWSCSQELGWRELWERQLEEAAVSRAQPARRVAGGMVQAGAAAKGDTLSEVLTAWSSHRAKNTEL